MANPTDQDKEKNPIAEIFDEMFTLLEDIETRNAALFEYMKEQGGVTDEKLAPYLDRAAAASDVRWRAARARTEHLLAPKPKSATEVGKDANTKEPSQSQPQAKEKDAETSGTKPQDEKKQEPKADSKNIGKELASTPAGGEKQPKSKDAPQNEKSSSERKAEENGQASALGGGKKPEPQNDQNSKAQTPQSDAGEKSSSQSSGKEKQQTQKAAK